MQKGQVTTKQCKDALSIYYYKHVASSLQSLIQPKGALNLNHKQNINNLTCPWITCSSWSALAPTNLQYNSGPSSPHVAVAVIFFLDAKLKYLGVKTSVCTRTVCNSIRNGISAPAPAMLRRRRPVAECRAAWTGVPFFSSMY